MEQRNESMVVLGSCRLGQHTHPHSVTAQGEVRAPGQHRPISPAQGRRKPGERVPRVNAFWKRRTGKQRDTGVSRHNGETIEGPLNAIVLSY